MESFTICYPLSYIVCVIYFNNQSIYFEKKKQDKYIILYLVLLFFYKEFMIHYHLSNMDSIKFSLWNLYDVISIKDICSNLLEFISNIILEGFHSRIIEKIPSLREFLFTIKFLHKLGTIFIFHIFFFKKKNEEILLISIYWNKRKKESRMKGRRWNKMLYRGRDASFTAKL